MRCNENVQTCEETPLLQRPNGSPKPFPPEFIFLVWPSGCRSILVRSVKVPRLVVRFAPAPSQADSVLLGRSSDLPW